MTYKNKSRSTPKMQRAHFELIASVLKREMDLESTGEGLASLYHATRAMCDALAATNPAFRRTDFLAACGMEE
jgi:hypothetical protein